MCGITKIVSVIKSSRAIFLYVSLVYLMLMFNHTKFVPGGEVGNSKNREEIRFILILCGGTGRQGSKQASDVGRQIRQAEVMLKSAVLFTKRRLHFHVIADSMKLFGRLVNRTAGWPDSYRRKIRFSMHDVWYPEVREGIMLLSYIFMIITIYLQMYCHLVGQILSFKLIQK